jgi:hypothetical protein
VRELDRAVERHRQTRAAWAAVAVDVRLHALEKLAYAFVGRRDAGELRGVRGEERDEVRPPVADDHGVGDVRRRREGRLDVLRRDVLARSRDDDVLLAARDGQEAVRVETRRGLRRRATFENTSRSASACRSASRCGIRRPS